MQLYYFPLSPYSQKALIALDEKGASFEPHQIDLGNPNDRAELDKVSPFGKVPVLRDAARDWTVPESSTIIEYLEHHVQGGTRLVPADAEESRQARFQDRIFDLYVTEPALKIFFDGLRPADKRDPMGVEQAQKRLDKSYALFDKYLAKRNWIMGDSFTIGDVSAAAALGVASRLRPFDEHKNLVAYFGRLRERPSVQRVFKQVAEYQASRART